MVVGICMVFVRVVGCELCVVGVRATLSIYNSVHSSVRRLVNPSAVRFARNGARWPARQIQSKGTEFVCLSSTRPLSDARNGAQRPD